jgi:hypothetical protein
MVHCGTSPPSLDLVQSIHFWWFRFGLWVVILSKVLLFDAGCWQSIHFKKDKARLWPGLFLLATISILADWGNWYASFGGFIFWW